MTGRTGGRGGAGRRGSRRARTGREIDVADDPGAAPGPAPARPPPPPPPPRRQEEQGRLDREGLAAVVLGPAAGRSGRGRGGRSIGRGRGSGQLGNVLGGRDSDVMAWQHDHHDQREKNSFQVGDACFTDIDGAIRSGTIIHLPVRGQRKQKFYHIKLHKQEGDDEEEEVVAAEVGSVYRPDDKVPALKNHDKRTRDASPWQSSRAKRFFHERLLSENDSIHDKTEDQVFHTSFYDNGEPVVKTKYILANFKANFKRLKATLARNKAGAMEDNAAFEFEQKLYPRPATDFHGHPYYAGSKIRSTLIGDVKSGAAAANRKKKPLEIIASQEDYAPFQNASKTFRNYLYRERRKESESVGWQLRRNKKGYKQHEKDHDEATSSKPSSNLGCSDLVAIATSAGYCSEE